MNPVSGPVGIGSVSPAADAIPAVARPSGSAAVAPATAKADTATVGPPHMAAYRFRQAASARLDRERELHLAAVRPFEFVTPDADAVPSRRPEATAPEAAALSEGASLGGVLPGGVRRVGPLEGSPGGSQEGSLEGSEEGSQEGSPGRAEGEPEGEAEAWKRGRKRVAASGAVAGGGREGGGRQKRGRGVAAGVGVGGVGVRGRGEAQEDGPVAGGGGSVESREDLSGREMEALRTLAMEVGREISEEEGSEGYEERHAGMVGLIPMHQLGYCSSMLIFQNLRPQM